ncbi:hypothetical protein FBY12_4464 [Pseudomonas sp. SJZ131]|nr:hypothetical protein FBY12_4464 [Pseudomonas sp. SJZ131]
MKTTSNPYKFCPSAPRNPRLRNASTLPHSLSTTGEAQ